MRRTGSIVCNRPPLATSDSATAALADKTRPTIRDAVSVGADFGVIDLPKILLCSRPNISRANSQTSSSLRACVSAVTGLPVSTLAKPHCGLIVSRSQANELGGVVELRWSAALVLKLGHFLCRVMRPEHHRFVRPGTESERRRVVAARACRIEEVEGDIHGHRTAARRLPQPPSACRWSSAIAAIYVCPYASPVCCDYPVGHVDIFVDQGAPIVAPRGEHCLHVGIAELANAVQSI